MSVTHNVEKPPSDLGVYFYAILTALVGGLLGFFYLTAFPAQTFYSQEEYEASIAELEEPIYSKPSDAYYIKGPVLKTRAWEAKRQQLSASGAKTVRLSAGEINSWMASKFRVPEPQAGDDGPNILILPGVPNVGLVDGRGFYLNLPITITAYGAKGDYSLSAFGNLKPSGMKIKALGIRSAKVPLPNLIGKQILNTLSAGYKSTKEYRIVSEALARIESVEVEGDELVIVLQ
ncbi:hypothetical protein N9Q19_00160 [Puniceicoccaceae bacterium]|nr:hypothetical protein [Puniceicoccaceae bacterium]